MDLKQRATETNVNEGFGIEKSGLSSRYKDE